MQKQISEDQPTKQQIQKHREAKAKADPLMGKYWEAAYRAHSGTSFYPEVRATDYILEYSKILAAEMEIVSELGGDPVSFRQKFERLFASWMATKSGCLSTMIAGPSNFPTRRAQKANRSEELRYGEFTNYRSKHMDHLRKQRRREARAAIDPVEEMREKIVRAEQHQELMKAANKILRSKKQDYEKAANLSAAGCPEKHISELMKPDYMGRIGFPSYQITNNLSNIKRMKDRLAILERRAAAETKEVERSDGIIVTENTEADRLQVTFPGIPSDEMRTKLKSRGFRWSPKGGCWQRQLTDNARHAAKEVLA